jgi:hypothetical protein
LNNDSYASELKLPVHQLSRFPVRRLIGLATLVLACTGGGPLYAQTQLLLGNPQVTSGLREQGYVITPSVSQTATTTTITYTVTPPVNPAALQDVGKINVQFVTLASLVSVTATVTFSGAMQMRTEGDAMTFLAGTIIGAPSPQIIPTNASAGTVSLIFSIERGASTTQQATISVALNVGSPYGARKAYLNDFDNDGKTDFSVWRPSSGNWYVLPSNNANPPTVTYWGSPGDVPVPGDYDGDGKTDFAVYRPSSGVWYVILSSTGQPTGTQWGIPGDIPVPGDYDGDGKTDRAIWRPSDGTWWYVTAGQTRITQWGSPGDIPVPGDYDGDGKTDFAVWRPSSGKWYVIPSTTNPPTVTYWGSPGDQPSGQILLVAPGTGSSSSAMGTESPLPTWF